MRWPLAVITDHDDVMASLPSTRGTFEKRLDMVEHCHLSYWGDSYLLVKQFDEQTDEVLLLGSSRSQVKIKSLLDALSVNDYILP